MGPEGGTVYWRSWEESDELRIGRRRKEEQVSKGVGFESRAEL
jgi:hypothetical protein